MYTFGGFTIQFAYFLHGLAYCTWMYCNINWIKYSLSLSGYFDREVLNVTI